MTNSELDQLTLTAAATAIRERALSPVELTRALLTRIERHDPALNSYVTVTADSALEEAATAEREITSGRYRGPLHGIPIALKDLIDTAGVVTACGMRILAARVPSQDAPVVTHLKEAGAVFLGKLNMHEAAYGVSTINPHFGPTRNPWDATRIPGGSSGGSGAAVGATLCLGALGTDTGGSIRIPASLCGIVGLKPTYGLISANGVFPLSGSLDHVGPMTKSVADCAALLEGMVKKGSLAESLTTLERAEGLSGLTVGVPRSYFFEETAPEVEAAVRRAVDDLAKLGARIEEIDFPQLEDLGTMLRTIVGSEGYTVHEENLRERGEQYGDDVRARLHVGQGILASQYLKMQQARQRLREAMGALFERIDLIATPATPVVALPIDPIARGGPDAALAAARSLTRTTGPFNLTGIPAISLPCGFSTEGLPIGLQLAADAHAEATLLRAAHAYEQATEWHRRRPVMSDE